MNAVTLPKDELRELVKALKSDGADGLGGHADDEVLDETLPKLDLVRRTVFRAKPNTSGQWDVEGGEAICDAKTLQPFDHMGTRLIEKIEGNFTEEMHRDFGGISTSSGNTVFACYEDAVAHAQWFQQRENSEQK